MTKVLHATPRAALLSLLFLGSFLGACASAGPPKPTTVPSGDQAAPTPEAKPEAADERGSGEERSAAGVFPPGWMIANDNRGGTVALHVPDNATEPDAVIRLAVQKRGAVTPSDDAGKFREGLVSDGYECQPVVLSMDAKSASFSWVAPEPDDGSKREQGKVMLRSLTAPEGAMLGCFGFWHMDVSYDGDFDLICGSIEVQVSAAGDTAVVPMVNADQQKPKSAKPSPSPSAGANSEVSVVTPPGWTFDASTGTGTKKDAAGNSVGQCKLNAVPGMEMTPAEHARAFADAMRQRAGGMMTPGEIVATADGSRASFPVTIADPRDPGGIVRGNGVVVIRKAAGLDGRFLLCMGNWKPEHPEVRGEAEAICDSFSLMRGRRVSAE